MLRTKSGIQSKRCRNSRTMTATLANMYCVTNTMLLVHSYSILMPFWGKFLSESPTWLFSLGLLQELHQLQGPRAHPPPPVLAPGPVCPALKPTLIISLCTEPCISAVTFSPWTQCPLGWQDPGSPPLLEADFRSGGGLGPSFSNT